MPDLYLFADEAGCFEFSRKQNVSHYFILCTIIAPDCEVGDALTELRRKLAWEGHELGDYFHATTDKQVVRDEVYATILKYDFSIQATIMEKPKARPHLKTSRARFYQFAWYYHFKHRLTGQFMPNTKTLVTTASLGSKRERKAFETVVGNVLKQEAIGEFKTDFCPAAADPCLSVVDYCAWAIQRKWEAKAKGKQDERSYSLIENRITAEYDLWNKGSEFYY